MRRTFYILALSLLATSALPAQTSTWIPDKAHSGVDFSVLHLAISQVHGHIPVASGQVVWNERDITKSTVNMVLDVSAIDTNNGMRDGDLKSDAFFDVAKFPSGTFASTAIKKPSEKSLEISGNLTVHGITKPVILHVEGPNGPVAGMDKKQHMGFSATTTLDRTDFGLGQKYPAAVVGNEVKLTIDLDLAQQ